jgi:hypothetical protein
MTPSSLKNDCGWLLTGYGSQLAVTAKGRTILNVSNNDQAHVRNVSGAPGTVMTG